MRRRESSIYALSLSSIVALAGCASSTPGAEPEDMSAEQHKDEAATHEAESKEHQARYDPEQSTPQPLVPSPGSTRLGIDRIDFRSYNPTEKHLGHAAAHQKHAADHRAAAEALAKTEVSECAVVPEPIRAICPLADQITGARDLEDGVALSIAKDVPPAALLAHARCHAAVGASLGRAGMNGCPLYLKGLTLSLDAGGTELEIRAPDPKLVEVLRARVRALMSSGGL